MSRERILSVGHRIRELRIAAGLSQEELAERIEGEVHFTTLSKIERSTRTISIDWIFKIAKALNVSPAELLAKEGDAPTRQVPVLGKIAAGNWREAVLDATEFVPVPGAGVNAFALRPDGDSMNELIQDGAIVVVDPDDFELRDGGAYAIMNGDGETTLKQYRSDPPRLEPRSTNPEHSPILLGRKPFTVVGRVVWQMSKI